MQQENGIIRRLAWGRQFCQGLHYGIIYGKARVCIKALERLTCYLERSKRDSLLISIKSGNSLAKENYFLISLRHKANMNLPMDWARINQFPEWFTGDKDREIYAAGIMTSPKSIKFQGNQLNRWYCALKIKDNKRMVCN